MIRLGLSLIFLLSMVGVCPAGEWNPNNFKALWKACEKGSHSQFVEELDKLEDRFSAQVGKKRRITEYGSFTDDEFVETGKILFPDLLPDDYPFRRIWKECWPPLLFLRRQIEENKEARPIEEAEEWHSCINLGYGNKPPLVAKKLKKCLIQLRLLEKEQEQ